MSDTKRRIEDLLSDWLDTCGQTRRSQAGSVYSSIQYPNLWSSFEVLLAQLLEEGYDEKYIKSAELNTKIAKTLLPDHLTIPGLNNERVKRMSIWYLQPGQGGGRKTVVGSHFKGKMGTPKELKIEAEKEPVKKKEIKFLDTFDLVEEDTVDVPAIVLEKPKDRIQIDTSDIEDPDLDLDFFKSIEEAEEIIKEGSKQ